MFSVLFADAKHKHLVKGVCFSHSLRFGVDITEIVYDAEFGHHIGIFIVN